MRQSCQEGSQRNFGSYNPEGHTRKSFLEAGNILLNIFTQLVEIYIFLCKIIGLISQSGFGIRIFSVVTQQERLASRFKTWGKHSKKNRIITNLVRTSFVREEIEEDPEPDCAGSPG